MWNYPHRGPGGSQHFKKAIAEVTTVELFLFLCHRKDNNYAYTLCLCMYPEMLNIFQVIRVCLYPIQVF